MVRRILLVPTWMALLAALLALGLGGWGCGALLNGAEAATPLRRLDRSLLGFAAAHRHPWLTIAVRAGTHAGSLALLVPVVLLAGLAWGRRRRTWSPLLLALSTLAGAQVLIEVLKRLVGRPRPGTALALVDSHGFAFPSGHALAAAAVWGLVAVLCGRWARRGAARAAAVTAAGVLALVAGGSRVYLGVHWPTDVLGGWALGAAWGAVVVTASGEGREAPAAGPGGRGR